MTGRKQDRSMICRVVILFGLAAVTACRGSSSAPPPPGGGVSTEGQARYRTELLQSALSLLSAPEQFDDEQQASEQLIERLNQWIRIIREMSAADPAESNKAGSTGEKADAQPAGVQSVVTTLPEAYRRTRWLRGLNAEVFDTTYDGPFLREAALLRDVANHVHGETRDDLSLAEALFDWTVRNVQLEAPPVGDSTPEEKWIALHLPTESVYYGRATPLGRAWVFMLLARQAGLDVVLLATPSPRDPEELRPWVTALVNDGQLYLFDYTYGLPIPGAGGKGIATLSQAAADDAVLRQMDIPGDRIYPRRAADLESVTALIEGSPGYLSKRMRMLDRQLAGRDRIVLSIDAPALVDKLRSIEHIAAVKLWEMPYETLQARSSLTPELERAMVLEQMPFSIPAEPEQMRQQDSRRRARPVYALRIGRLLQLRGLFGATDSSDRPGAEGELSAIAERGAKYYYLRAMPTQEQLEDLVRMQRQGQEIIPGRTLSKELIDAAEAMRDDAVYWLGIISLEQEAFKTATQYFGPMTLEADPHGPWTNGVQFNLAQAYEALGKIEDAIRLYEADRSPQRYGNRLRAFWLKSRTAANEAAAPAKGLAPGAK